jgi:hypothetical protein
MSAPTWLSRRQESASAPPQRHGRGTGETRASLRYGRGTGEARAGEARARHGRGTGEARARHGRGTAAHRAAGQGGAASRAKAYPPVARPHGILMSESGARRPPAPAHCSRLRPRQAGSAEPPPRPPDAAALHATGRGSTRLRATAPAYRRPTQTGAHASRAATSSPSTGYVATAVPILALAVAATAAAAAAGAAPSPPWFPRAASPGRLRSSRERRWRRDRAFLFLL